MSSDPATETLLTPEGYRRLCDELAELTEVRRAQVAEELQEAAALPGDPTDKIEYLEVRREQQRLEQRIATLEEYLRTAQVVEPDGPRGVAAVGSEVKLEDVVSGAQETYRLVGSPEAAPAEGRLSVASPVGRALVGRRAGDVVEVKTPRQARQLRVLSVGAGRRPRSR